MHGKNKTIDASLGDPLFPLTKVANHAFQRSKESMTTYMYSNPLSPDASSVHREALANISEYFTTQGFCAPGWNGLPLDSGLFTGGGTTEAYELIIRMLAADIKKTNSKLEKHDRKIKPVILMPTPTYGYFMDQPKAHNIEIVKIPLDLSKGGHLSPKQLHEAIEAVNAQGKRVVSLYLTNPHNPLGYIRTEEETRAIGKVINYHNNKYKEEEWKWVNEGEKIEQEPTGDDLLDMMGPHTDRHPWEGVASRIRIIDDMVYYGLEYSADGKKPFSFSQIEECFDDTFSLFGLSKVGLTNVRAGYVIADNKHIRELTKIQRQCCYFPSTLAMHALETYFSNKEPRKRWREDHLAKTNEAYRFNGLFMKALINGLKDVPEATEDDITRMVNLLVRHKKGGRKAAHKRLDTPLKKAKIITTPEAGFFHLLDTSALKGTVLDNKHVHYKRHEGQTQAFEISDSGDISLNTDYVFDRHQIKMACGTWTGSTPEEMLHRVSFSMKPAKIIGFVDRLAESLDKFKAPKVNTTTPLTP